MITSSYESGFIFYIINEIRNLKEGSRILCKMIGEICERLTKS